MARIEATASFRPFLDFGLDLVDGGITGDEPPRVVPLWGPDGTALLADLPADMFIDVNDRAVSVALYSDGVLGKESELRTMVGYARDIAAVVRGIQARAPTSPVASALAPFMASLARFAEDHGLELGRNPLVVDGQVHGSRITIAAERVDKCEYRLSARLRPDNKSLKGVTLTRTRDVGPDWVEAEGDDVDFEDPKLTEVYRARSLHSKAATLLASPPVREWLAEMFDRGYAPRIHHGRVEFSGAKLDREAPDQMSNLGEALLALVPALSAAPSPPYR